MIDSPIFNKYPKQLTWLVAAVFAFLLIILISWFISYQTSRVFINKMQPNQKRECGNVNREQFSNLELINAFKFAYNNNPQKEENNKFPAGQLIDGNRDTFAYPNSKQLNYSIDLIDIYDIKDIMLVWNEYGEKESYVSKWMLEGCDENGSWTTLGRGGFPQAKETNIKIDGKFSEIRLRAEAQKDWIGIYEIVID